MNLSYQKRVASGILKCGVHRVWVDDRPEVQERIAEAVTRDDVRLLVVQRFIRKHQKKGISRGRAKAMANQRSKGRAGAWIQKGTWWCQNSEERSLDDKGQGFAQ